ncbi:MAG: hypothetical protein R2731_17785 [Nocardioides sp.]
MSATPDPRDGDWHRRQGVEANNTTWELLDRTDRSPDDDEELLRRAYTAAYHWQRATTAGPANEARAAYTVAKALLATGQPERALTSADRCLAQCGGRARRLRPRLRPRGAGARAPGAGACRRGRRGMGAATAVRRSRIPRTAPSSRRTSPTGDGRPVGVDQSRRSR